MNSRQYLTGKIPDHVDGVLAQWERAAPDLDTAHLGVVARVLRLAHQMRVRAEALLGRHGLTQGEFDVLCALRRSDVDDGLTPGALAGATLVSSGGMTKRLAGLEEEGWIERIRSARDGRSVRVRLTPHGRARLDALLPIYFAAEAEAVGSLGEGDRERLAGLLRQLSIQQDLLR